MSAYYDAIIHANSHRKYKDVQQMVDMLDHRQQCSLIRYMKEKPTFLLDNNLQDTHNRVLALLDLPN